MSTAELKNYLHKVIVETDDEAVLNEIKNFVRSIQPETPQWQQDVTQQRLNDYLDGKVQARPWSEAKQEIFKK